MGARIRVNDVHLAPGLVQRGLSLTGLVETFAPDVMVTNDGSIESYVAACVYEIPLLVCHLQADLLDLRQAVRLSPHLLAQADVLLERCRKTGPQLWRNKYPLGNADVVLSDTLLVGRDAIEIDDRTVQLVGSLPQITRLPGVGRAAWPDAKGPRVLVSTGSSLGGLIADELRQWLVEITQIQCSVVVAGPGVPVRSRLDAVSYVPWLDFRRQVESADIVVHHAGVATSLEVVRARTPSVVFPRIFDQHRNAHRLVQLGLAARIDPGGLVAACRAAAEIPLERLEKAAAACASPEETLQRLRHEVERLVA